MEQNHYPNQPGMLQQNGMNQWNRQNPYGAPHPQQNMPYPGQPMAPQQAGMNPQNLPPVPNRPQDPKSKKAAKKV